MIDSETHAAVYMAGRGVNHASKVSIMEVPPRRTLIRILPSCLIRANAAFMTTKEFSNIISFACVLGSRQHEL